MLSARARASSRPRSIRRSGSPSRSSCRLPAGTSQARADASIVVWAIVLSDGSVDTALLADGDESLAEPVLAAVKAARFVPARSRLQPRDYPVSLEFRFSRERAPQDPAERVVSAAGSASLR